uniref:Ras family protein n=1 Tax=Bursaphelenchus xylophilus TaxID=6326 RepID=A0A1I7S7M4_BURXY
MSPNMAVSDGVPKMSGGSGKSNGSSPMITLYEQLQLQQIQANSSMSSSSHAQAIQTIKCVVEGDRKVGRTSLLKVYTGELDDSRFDEPCSSENSQNSGKTSALRNFSAELRMDGRPIYLIMHETEAGSDFDHLRRLHYAETDCFVLCFSVVKPETFDSIRNFWYLEVIEHCQKWPTIILVGTMVDLREDPDTVADLQERGKQPITCEQGMRLAKDIKAARYLECSAKTKVGISTVFHEAVRAVLAPPEIPSGTKLPKGLQDDWNCSIM